MNTIRIHFYEVRNDDYESRGRSRNLRPPLYKERNHATAVDRRCGVSLSVVSSVAHTSDDSMVEASGAG